MMNETLEESARAFLRRALARLGQEADDETINRQARKIVRALPRSVREKEKSRLGDEAIRKMEA